MNNSQHLADLERLRGGRNGASDAGDVRVRGTAQRLKDLGFRGFMKLRFAAVACVAMALLAMVPQWGETERPRRLLAIGGGIRVSL